MNLETIYKTFSEKGLSVSIDTRTIKPGDVFFALRGENFDGNKFALEALEKGASFCISENRDMPMDERCLLVNDPLKALQDFALIHRTHLGIPIIAITGSNGKTTTKELTKAVLEKKYKVLASPSSFNNHIGVPLTILSIKPGHQIAVIEMGDNHEGEISMLCDIARPTHGLITNIGRDHIGEAGGYEANVRAKLELYGYMASSNAKNFLNTNDEKLVQSAVGLENIPYAGGEVISGDDLLEVLIEGKNIKTKFVGEYNLDNFRAAWTIGKTFEVGEDDMVSVLESYEPKNNRSQKIESGTNTIIMDAYNANPDSMKLALENFALMKTDKKKVVILGDMFDLGEFGPEEHQRVLDQAEVLGYESYFAGVEFDKLKGERKNVFKTTSDLIEHLKQNKIENSFVLLKGSRGMALEKILKEGCL